jgi:hypothetical protein
LRRNEKLWTYHKTQLRDMGVGFSWFAVMRGALTEFGKAIFAPQKLITKLSGHRQSRSHDDSSEIVATR